MCSSGQCLLLSCAKLQQMDEVSTFVILINVAATFVLNGQIGYIYLLSMSVKERGLYWQTIGE
ncbi:hypothetical protein [Bacillus manliponensis]|uniref:hypothetical protein n=1 Tax=Bacillus manliponensis TaxID=574376 RepID=UPI003517A473